MYICPFLHSECLKEKCALWNRQKNDEFSKCGLNEIVRAAVDANIKSAIKRKSETHGRDKEECPF